MNEPSHADLQRDLGKVEGALVEIRNLGQARDAQLAALRSEMGATREDVAALQVIVQGVKATGEKTDAKVDRLVAILERGKGAAWGFVKAWGLFIAGIGLVGAALAYVATNLSDVKKLMGLGS